MKDTADISVQCLRAGAVDCISAPLSLEVLQNRVGTIIESNFLKQELRRVKQENNQLNVRSTELKEENDELLVAKLQLGKINQQLAEDNDVKSKSLKRYPHAC